MATASRCSDDCQRHFDSRAIAAPSQANPMASPSFGAKEEWLLPDLKHLASLSAKVQFQFEEDGNGPVPQIALRKTRFLAIVIGGVAVTTGVLACFLDGLTIENQVFDTVGTSTNADKRVALYQVVSGFISAAIGLLLEQYYKIFIAVLLVYFANRPWYPGDTVSNGPTPFKVKALFWFTPLMMYVVNIGISSVFIEHKIDGVVRAFVDSDLVNNDALTITTLSGKSKTVSVEDTIMRAAVRNRVEAFHVNDTSTCASNITTIEKKGTRTVYLPSGLDLQSTSVTYGFHTRGWNIDAIPASLTPAFSVKLVQGNAAVEQQMQELLDDFLRMSGVTYEQLSELLVQGLAVHGKASTDSNIFMQHLCDPLVGEISGEVIYSDDTATPTSTANPTTATSSNTTTPASTNGTTPKDTRRLAVSPKSMEIPDGDGSSSEGYEGEAAEETFDTDRNGVKICYGAGNFLHYMVDFHNASNRRAQALFDSLYNFVGIDLYEITATIDVFVVSPQLNVTTLTFDLPYGKNETYDIPDPDICTKNFTFRDPAAMAIKYPTKAEYDLREYQSCSPSVVMNDEPYHTCGERNCIVEDSTEVLNVNKQVLMSPYMKYCDAFNVTYDREFSSWFPANCTPQSDSAFVYGLGSYFEGDLEKRGGHKGPIVHNARRHYELTMAKVNWRYEDLSKRFNAECEADTTSGCEGLVHGLANVHPKTTTTRVLLMGKDRVSKSFERRTLKNPLPLVVLREPKFYVDEEAEVYYTYEYMDIPNMNTTYTEEETLGLDPGECSLYLDAYLNHIKANHLYIPDPRQVVYTSVFFYLFQDALVKEVTLPKKNTLGAVDLTETVLGTARMDGDQETKEIRYSVPLASVVSTLLGIVMLVLYMVIILLKPRDAVKQTDETNAAAKYTDVLVDDSYPERIHTRQLRLPDSDSLVEMDDYTVHRLVFRNLHAPEHPVVME